GGGLRARLLVRRPRAARRGRPTDRALRRADRRAAADLRPRAHVRLLAFSDVHRDRRQAKRLAEMAADADVVIAAGDFASVHRGLGEIIDMLVVIETPTVLVPGNNETDDAPREACRGWQAAAVLHG